MKFFENLKKDYQKVKGKPFKEKLSFFWDYYKIPLICIVLVLVLMVQGILSTASQKSIAFSGVLLNCGITLDEDPFLEGYYEHAGIDADTQMAAFYTDMLLYEHLGNDKNNNTIQRVIAGISVQDTDVISGDAYAFQVCAYNSSRIFMDLREFLDAETLEKYKDRLYYVDEHIIELIASKDTNLKALEYPADPKKPETMQNPVPVGIDVTDCEAFYTTYYKNYAGNTPVIYIGVVKNAPHPELAKQFISYLFS